MSDLVPADQIEQIVGASRHATRHIGRAVSTEHTVYILHSEACKATTPDLRTCDYSVALDRGIHLSQWLEDRPVVLSIGGVTGRLIGDLAWMSCDQVCKHDGTVPAWMAECARRDGVGWRPCLS